MNQNIPQEISQVSQDFAKAHKDILPGCYVVDFGIDREKGPVVIEINGLVASGRYGGNCFKKFLLDLADYKNKERLV